MDTRPEAGYESDVVRRAVARSALFASIVVGSVAAHPTHARADSTDDARALDLFAQSERAYENGRFRDAVDLLLRSYALKKEPVVLYNLARAYEGLGDLDDAARAYEQYLAAQPDTTDRAAIEQRVVGLHRAIAERDAARRAAAARPPPRKPSAVPWIVAGAGVVVGGGAGTVLEVLALNRHADANRESAQLTAEADQRDAKSLAAAATVAFVAGGVVAAAGVVWGIVDLGASSRSSATTTAAASAELVPLPNGVALRVRAF